MGIDLHRQSLAAGLNSGDAAEVQLISRRQRGCSSDSKEAMRWHNWSLPSLGPCGSSCSRSQRYPEFPQITGS